MGKMIMDEFTEDKEYLPTIIEKHSLKPVSNNPLKMQVNPDTVKAIENAGVDVALAAACPPLALVSMGIQAVTQIVPALANMHQNIRMAEEQTKQVEAVSRQKIREAEELTVQTRIKETELTKRTYMECQTKIQLAEINLNKLEKELMQRQNEIMANDILFNKALSELKANTEPVIEVIKKLSGDGVSKNFDSINQTFQSLIEINRTIVSLYAERNKNTVYNIGENE